MYFSFSGGKDSLVMAQLIADLAQEGSIDISLLTVQFIDEEAVYDCIEEKVKEWRKRFMLMGAKFEWFCIEVRHYNCFNQLSNDESFFCWDSQKQDVWVRQPPSFAIRDHKKLRPRRDTYQDFLPRISSDGLTIVGIRTAESLQRLQSISRSTQAGHTCTVANKSSLFTIGQITTFGDTSKNDRSMYP